MKKSLVFISKIIIALIILAGIIGGILWIASGCMMRTKEAYWREKYPDYENAGAAKRTQQYRRALEGSAGEAPAESKPMTSDQQDQ